MFLDQMLNESIGVGMGVGCTELAWLGHVSN